MSSVAITSSQQRFNFPEDSLALKALSAVPLIGFLPLSYVLETLHLKFISLDRNMDKEKAIKLIQIKNDYLLADGIRNLLTVVLLVARIAFGAVSVFWIVCFGALAGLHLGSAFTNSDKLKHNKKAIEEIQEQGLRPGLTVR